MMTRWDVWIDGRHDAADTFDTYEEATNYVESLDDDDYQRTEIIHHREEQAK